MPFPSFWRMPESSGFSDLDTGLRRYDKLIRVSLKNQENPDAFNPQTARCSSSQLWYYSSPSQHERLPTHPPSAGKRIVTAPNATMAI